jgi:putative transposase
MAELGLHGVRRGKRYRTTIADPAAVRPADLVDRQFGVLAPNRLWVADFTYVASWAGTVYVAFVIDAYARRILGWRAAYSMKTALVLDALEQAIWTRTQAGIEDLTGLIHHTDAGSLGTPRSRSLSDSPTPASTHPSDRSATPTTTPSPRP